MPGQRSMTAIERLRRERRNRREHHQPERPPLAARADAAIAARFTAEIRRRGGEVTIDSRYDSLPLAIADRPLGGEHKGMVLLKAEGWRAYSRAFGHRWAAIAYLAGTEDGQLWAVRVPGTVTTVRGALHWMTPADVRNAQARGARVARQGDVYAVQTPRHHDGAGAEDLPDTHTWNPGTRTLSHPQHGDLHLTYPVRFVMQRHYGMGRGAGRAGYAD